MHEAEYGYAHNDPIEVVNLRVTATGRRPRLRRLRATSGDLDSATISTAPTMWRVDGTLVELETHRLLRERLPIDVALPTPAIIFQRDTTIAVAPGWSARASSAGPLLLTAQAPAGVGGDTNGSARGAQRR